MALLLQLGSILQSNDCTTLKVQDATGTYSGSNLGGWGTPNTTLSSLDSTSTNALSITVTITTSDGIETVYDPINVYTYLEMIPTVYTDILVYVTPEVLKISGVSIGEATDTLPDGWYDIRYRLYTKSTGVDISTYTFQGFVDGIIRNKIYKMLRDVPTNLYINTPNRVNVPNWEELTYPLYVLSIFEGTIAYVTTARKNEVLNDLNLIERLTYNVSL